MSERREERSAGDEPAVRPGAFSALLQELACGGLAAEGAAWDRALQPGAIIGRFELVRELGRGGFGVVYEARDRELGRAVAFKAVKAGSRSGAHEERLLREAEAAARLAHPNIVTLYDVGRSEHGPYLVLELLRGQTLAQRLRQGRLSVREAVRVAREVATGIAHAHGEGVVHRDLTPGNVFLCDDGRVKVLDLGLAHAFGRRKLDGGTPAYMAPEQWRGAPEDERTDVWALGVILHQMLAGDLPFRGEGPPRALPPELDVPEAPALGELVTRALERDPVRRPRDGGELLAALSAIERELERTPSTSARATVHRRHRALRIAVLAVAVLAFCAIVVTAARVRTGPEPPARGLAAAAPSIAILPFVDLSPQHDQEYFSDGIAEEILNALVHVDGVKVAGRTSSFSFKGKNATLSDVGRALHVAHVLEGSVRKSGGRVRITAQLVNVADGYHRWSEAYDRELADVFAVQEEIAQAVVSALKVSLAPGRAPTTSERRTGSAEAYNEYLLGRQLYLRHSNEGHRRATQAYERALALDPGYAPAHAQLALVLRARHYEEDDPGAAAEFRRRALEEAERAVALGPDLPEAYSIRGFLRSAWRRDWKGAEVDLRRALELGPGDSPTHRRLGMLLASQGRLAAALAEAERSTQLDALDSTNWMWLGLFQTAMGRTDLARRAELERSRSLPRATTRTTRSPSSISSRAARRPRSRTPRASGSRTVSPRSPSPITSSATSRSHGAPSTSSSGATRTTPPSPSRTPTPGSAIETGPSSGSIARSLTSSGA